MLTRRELALGVVATSVGRGILAEAQTLPPCDVFLWVGDSNTNHGMTRNGTSTTTPGYDPAIDVTNPSCLEFRRDGSLVIAKDPFDWDGFEPVGSISSALTFMRDGWLPNLSVGRSVCAIAAGRGGSQVMTQWQPPPPSTNFYAYALLHAVSRANQALANPNLTLRGIIWQGGANDMVKGVSTSTFIGGLTNTFNYLRANIIGAQNVPITVTGFPQYMTRYSGGAAIDNALRMMPQTIARCGYVDTGNGWNDPSALLGWPVQSPEHFDNVAQRTLGVREAQLMAII